MGIKNNEISKLELKMYVRRYNQGEEKELWELYFDTTHLINRKDYTEEQVERWAPHDKNMDEWTH